MATKKKTYTVARGTFIGGTPAKPEKRGPGKTIDLAPEDAERFLASGELVEGEVQIKRTPPPKAYELPSTLKVDGDLDAAVQLGETGKTVAFGKLVERAFELADTSVKKWNAMEKKDQDAFLDKALEEAVAHASGQSTHR